MSEYWIEIRLRVPDNTAYTALGALRRLGVEVSRVERAEIVRFDAAEEEAALAAARSDESIFNPSLHELRARPDAPMNGEVFVRSFDSARFARYAQDDKAIARDAFTVWRLSSSGGIPVSRAVLERACEALLCHPAIEEAVLPA